MCAIVNTNKMAEAWKRGEHYIIKYEPKTSPANWELLEDWQPALHSDFASFPGPAQLSIAISTESGRGPGIFSHMSDVGIERMVERV